ncbi:PLP-dependent aminotransferase family protein [Corynebacterium sp. zg-331]|uniref:MocR-like pyridoxine biosynthesis transcription factor PdxR n=1 Tax=unclassified Corynebacterium TaxID=2624378 RepID=UPI00128D6BA6|nr:MULTISPECIES: PLP-dependent aminotransferase family protein [unclassified Corynebacterium]MBC3185051.1 PLP-dependent aminotransferase family protein [Corynebacterium sp. zg-331]MPV51551.1 aminotransferase class I/II-fold pyridoxal phosphate-dependent enzyme [Corynebacterium sp. zg331]
MIALDRSAGNLPHQITRHLRRLIDTGRLAPGDCVPSTRALAADLGVSRGTVVTAYEQLSGEGYLVAGHGGTLVNPDLPATHAPPRLPASSKPREARRRADLRPGIPNTEALTGTAWRAAWRRAAAHPSRGYPVPGAPRLRELIAEHLRITRSVPATPEDVLVTSGARDGLRTLLDAVGNASVVAVEDPGYPSLRAVLREHGHRVVPIPVDGEGIEIAALERVCPQVVLVTPSHQYPLGAAMSAPRRRQLLDYAAAHGLLVVEDDYDSELRYVGQPHPALAAVDTAGCVATLGSFSKTITPGLGLGFVFMPAALREALCARATPASGMVQDAMTYFMEDEGLRHHLARMRREYKKRRDLFADVFAREAAEPMDGGLHAVVYLDDARAEAEVVVRCARRGLAVQALSEYWSSPQRSGIVLGIGAYGSARTRELLGEVREVIHQVDRIDPRAKVDGR